MCVVSHVIAMLHVISHHSIPLYPCLYLRGESYCSEANRFPAKQEIPTIYRTELFLPYIILKNKTRIVRSLKSGKTELKIKI